MNTQTAASEPAAAGTDRKALYAGVGIAAVVLAAVGAGALAWRKRRSRS